MAKRERPFQIKVYVNSKEQELINTKVKSSGLSRSECLRKLWIDGEVKYEDTTWEKEKYSTISNLIEEINKIGTNINQMAKHCNQIGSITYEDYKFLKKRLDDIWQLLKTKL